MIELDLPVLPVTELLTLERPHGKHHKDLMLASCGFDRLNASCFLDQAFRPHQVEPSL